jgi:hypothetical protein
LLPEVRRNPALLNSKVPQVGEKLINGSEHGLDLFDMFDPHLVDVHELDFRLVREIFEDLAEFFDAFLVNDHVFICFPGEDDGFNIGICDNLVSNVLVAEGGELQVGDADLYFALVGVQTTKEVAAGEESVEKAEVGIENSHDEANINDSIGVFASTICLSQIVELEKKLRGILKDELKECHPKISFLPFKPCIFKIHCLQA